MIATSDSIIGTSTRTRTTVASAAPEFRSNSDMATPTASLKKFEVPIRQDGPEMLCDSFIARAARSAKGIEKAARAFVRKPRLSGWPGCEGDGSSAERDGENGGRSPGLGRGISC